ncbi:hypothetical protein [Allokutzneria sp. NRRL B-24872]|uniref:hypothetical protein n=1 Tax=Allokutzneria sp. NRRL B-24872 TaxID=1137961 RepID=UPI000A3715B7|nr:hypothetical protein [Allokutzneria sp. NRRL B-24872]
MTTNTQARRRTNTYSAEMCRDVDEVLEKLVAEPSFADRIHDLALTRTYVIDQLAADQDVLDRARTIYARLGAVL